MKNWLKRNFLTICSACLGYTMWYRFDSVSLFLFGEPDYPTED